MSNITKDAQIVGLPPEQRITIETFYQAFAGDPDLLDQVVAADWQDIPPAPGQGPGAEGVKPVIRLFKSAFPDLRIVVKEVIGVSGRLAVRAEIVGTHYGEWFGIPPTGKSFRLPLHEFHRIENGRLTHTWHLEDWFGWLNQVGAWPVQKESV